jgi:hypothetical protein
MPFDIEIDKLTNSIENALTEEVFPTEVSRLFGKDTRQVKRLDWQFNWHQEIKDVTRQVYKLTTVNNPAIIHGMISLSDKKDHIFMELIENARFNKGKKKQYNGVAGNLVAYGCKLSFEKKYDGIVSFVAKTKLIDHYRQTLGPKYLPETECTLIPVNRWP